MVIYKIVGSISIIISAIVLYFEMQKFEKQKINQITAYILLIEYIKNQIECFLLPIDIIIHNCSKNIIDNCRINIDHTKVENLEELIMSAEFYCNAESIDLIKQFAKDFGQGYMQEQLRSCDYYRTELIKQRDHLKEKSTKEKKLRFALCLCASFSLILLLV